LLEIGPLNSTKVVDFNAGIIFVKCCLFQNKSFLARDKPIIIHGVYMLSEINDDFIVMQSHFKEISGGDLAPNWVQPVMLTN